RALMCEGSIFIYRYCEEGRRSDEAISYILQDYFAVERLAVKGLVSPAVEPLENRLLDHRLLPKFLHQIFQYWLIDPRCLRISAFFEVFIADKFLERLSEILSFFQIAGP